MQESSGPLSLDMFLTMAIKERPSFRKDERKGIVQTASMKGCKTDDN